MQISVRMEGTLYKCKNKTRIYICTYVHVYVYMLLITLDYADKGADREYIIQLTTKKRIYVCICTYVRIHAFDHIGLCR
jgi:hypothetical protein